MGRWQTTAVAMADRSRVPFGCSCSYHLAPTTPTPHAPAAHPSSPSSVVMLASQAELPGGQERRRMVFESDQAEGGQRQAAAWHRAATGARDSPLPQVLQLQPILPPQPRCSLV